MPTSQLSGGSWTLTVYMVGSDVCSFTLWKACCFEHFEADSEISVNTLAFRVHAFYFTVVPTVKIEKLKSVTFMFPTTRFVNFDKLY